MRTKRIPIAALAVVVAGGVAVGGTASVAATKSAKQKTVTTTSGLKKAKWGKNVGLRG